MPQERLHPGFSLNEERIAQLKAVVPEAFADGKVNWVALREGLGDWLEESGEGMEHFGLTWPGKRDARRLATLPSPGTLVPVRGEGVDEEKTRNLFIEGDNLEVLKLLQKSYAGRVKMIYIDPPYNTGTDFIYEDDFTEPIEAYLRRTGQLDEKGRPLTTNTRATGRFHSKWLSMLYPRLRLAMGLLRSDGFIVVSIDDNEFGQLRSLLNEIFGEENFLAVLVYDRNRKNDARFFSVGHEYMVVYARNKDFLTSSDVELRLPKEGVDDVREKWSELRAKYADDWVKVQADLRAWFKTLPVDDPKLPLARFSKVDEKGPYRDDGDASWPGGGGPRYTVLHPRTGKPCKIPNRGWVYATSERMQEMIKKGVVVFGADETFVPKIRSNLFERTEQVMRSVHYSYAQTAAQQFDKIFDGKRVFDNPKPYLDLGKLVEYLTGPDDLVVDFFAGSASVGHAVFERNRALGTRRSFLLVQLPETIDAKTKTGATALEMGMNTISEIGKERLRRVIQQLKKEKKPRPNEDLGFRVLRLARSHYQGWADYEGDNLDKVIDLFAMAQETLVEGWTPEGLLTEVMLIEGFPLDSQIESLSNFNKNAVTKVTSDYCAHKLVVCLDDKVYADSMNALALSDTDVFVCLDKALSDEAKVSLADRCILKTV